MADTDSNIEDADEDELEGGSYVLDEAEATPDEDLPAAVGGVE